MNCKSVGCSLAADGLYQVRGFISKIPLCTLHARQRKARLLEELMPPRIPTSWSIKPTEEQMSRVCIVVGCSKIVTARGLCPTHHQAWRVSGKPDGVALPSTQGNRQLPADDANLEEKLATTERQLVLALEMVEQRTLQRDGERQRATLAEEGAVRLASEHRTTTIELQRQVDTARDALEEARATILGMDDRIADLSKRLMDSDVALVNSEAILDRWRDWAIDESNERTTWTDVQLMASVDSYIVEMEAKARPMSREVLEVRFEALLFARQLAGGDADLQDIPAHLQDRARRALVHEFESIAFSGLSSEPNGVAA